jgi:hypothetical protein
MRHVLDSASLLSIAFGLAMVAAAGIDAGGTALVVATAALVAVVAGIRIRVASTFAVLLAGAAVMLTDASPAVAGLAGLSAACYLVLRHREGRTAEPVGASSTPLIAALGFTVVVVSAAFFPLQLSWLPLLAPLPVFAIYLLAIWPFLTQARRLRETVVTRQS